jgi:hypothetical protein
VINEKENPVEWAMLITELDEAREHLDSLIKTMAETESVDESEYAVQLGHVFAHLNRAWNSRELIGQIGDGEWQTYSAFPDDLDPVG